MDVLLSNFGINLRGDIRIGKDMEMPPYPFFGDVFSCRSGFIWVTFSLFGKVNVALAFANTN